MNQPLSETGFAHDQAAVPVLDCAGDDLACARGAVVDEDDEGDFLERIAVPRLVRFLELFCPCFRVDDGLRMIRSSASEKEVCDALSLLEVPAGVAAQIEYET